MDDVTAAAERLATELTPADLDETLGQITAAAVQVLPQVRHASITVLHRDGRLDTTAPTHDLLVEVDAEQQRLREGPCVTAAEDGVRVVSHDVRVDERYPRYGPAAAAHGIRSQVGLTLFTGDRSHAALNLYSSQVGSFDEPSAIEALFATQAGTAIRYAQEIDDLKRAISTRTVIGQATGLVMERYGLTDERAFALLKRLSSTQNQPLREVAADLVARQNEQ